MPKWLVALAAFPHEICHYLTAKALGFEPIYLIDRVRVPGRYGWRSSLITAAPILAGLPICYLLWLNKKGG